MLEYQPQTQTTRVILNQIINITESKKRISPADVTGIPILTIPSLIRGFTVPLQVHAKNIRRNSDFLNGPKTSQNFPSQDNYFGRNCHQCQFKTLQQYHFPILIELKGR